MRFYDKENCRLIYLQERATPDFWDRRWDVTDFAYSAKRSKNSRSYLNTLHKYMPDKRGLVLEGGCGSGRLVYSLHTHGYRCIGVDYAQETIQRIKDTFPELDVRVADVRSLPFPDNYFRAYISGGVIEHFWAGYHDILREMRRVLVKGGYVFLSFPYMSFLRKLKARLNLYKEFNGEKVDVENFYQFALNGQKVIEDFETAGFSLLNSRPRVGVGGLIKEVSLFDRSLLQRYYRYAGNNLFILGSRFLFDKILAHFAGHAIFLVFQKNVD